MELLMVGTKLFKISFYSRSKYIDVLLKYCDNIKR